MLFIGDVDACVCVFQHLFHYFKGNDQTGGEVPPEVSKPRLRLQFPPLIRLRQLTQS